MSRPGVRDSMRGTRTFLMAAIVVATALAGCMAERGGRGPDDGSDSSTSTAVTTASGQTSSSSQEDRFAVLIVDGDLRREGPPPERMASCSVISPNGMIDFEANRTWARPGRHSFKPGETWLVVLDRVDLDDPRGSGCQVRLMAPFAGEAGWTPQTQNRSFRLDLGRAGDNLTVGKTPLAPENAFRASLTFEEGDSSFTGNVTFTHAGWWPTSAFEERDEEADHESRFSVWWS